MTDEQAEKFRALSYCTFAVGSPDKRFVRDMHGFAGDLTAKQADYLDRLCYRYRRQLRRFVPSQQWQRWVAYGSAALARKDTQP